ncbi:MAG: hypothetical protein FWE12_05165 [Oscillospiraceae bacterium]|nr:hypothetical protein [Oscillospiraceae bacterium]
MNRKIIIIKWVAVIVYALAIIALYFNFENIGYSVFSVIGYFVLLIVSFSGWMVVVFVCATSHFAKMIINRKMEQAERQLGNISHTQLDSYRRNMVGDYVTLKFRSVGVTKEDWENKRSCVQSALNYTIIGEIDYYKGNWDVIVFDARKGRSCTDSGGLYDDEF